jgi:hypothetical protein
MFGYLTGDADVDNKLVSNYIKCYTSFVTYLYLLNILHERYTEGLKKIHGPELEVTTSVPFNVDVAYAAGGGILHGRYVKISIIFH